MLVDRTSDPLMQLQVDATRRIERAGPDLARAHREVGRALAADVARRLPLENTPIQHPTGATSGVRIRPDAEPILVAMMRSGLFIAEGLWESLPGSTLVLHDARGGALEHLPARGRTLVIVDAVINTGESMSKVLQQAAALQPASLLAVTLVGFRPTVERLVRENCSVEFIVARMSERSYVGVGGTDTGARLFGTTSWGKTADR